MHYFRCGFRQGAPLKKRNKTVSCISMLTVLLLWLKRSVFYQSFGNFQTQCFCFFGNDVSYDFTAFYAEM